MSLLTVNDVSKALKLHIVSVYKMTRTGEIPSVRIGRSVRVREEDLLTFIENKRDNER